MAVSESEVVDFRDLLHEKAIERASHDDFGPDSYKEGLTVLLRSILTEIPHARHAAEALIVPHLTSRLVTQRGFARHPELRDTPIDAPLVILGLPRSGTTALHQLLSVDPQFQGLESWLSGYPMPRPPRQEWESIPAYTNARAARAAAYARNPEIRAAHPVEVDDVDECLVPLSQEFSSNLFASMFGTRGYTEWHETADEAPSYRRYLDILKLVGGQGDSRRWLLKNPGHSYGVDRVLETFPDAMMVQTHRNPAEIIGSIASLLSKMRRGIVGEFDAKALARRELHYWGEAARRTIAAQQRAPDRFVNVDYRSFIGDPIGSIRSVYDRFGLRLTPSVEAAMQAWTANNPQNKHGQHRYSLSDFGLDQGDIDAVFHEYSSRYAV